MMNNKAVWVALGVLAIATAMMIFFVMPNISDTGKDVSATAEPGTEQADKPAGEGEAASALNKGGRVPGSESAAPDGAADEAGETAASGAVIPSFDVLRVEPDGSTVIAGRAEPGTRLEIVDGDKVLATADVGPSGDFAAVFDKPLDAGDYQLSLRTTGKDGQTRTSEEVATVSVPTGKTGELLAMVSKPGKASRLITTPEASAGAAGQDTAAAGTDTAAPAATEETGQETASADVDDDKPEAEVTAETATKPQDTKEAASGEQTEAAGTAVETPGSGTAEASATATGNASAGSAAQVRVSAVEIEGDKVFVAGSARPGAQVRVYADDALLGEGKADEAGRFVIDGSMPLSVGNHVIRADVLNADGSAVEFRASVPFDRPIGDQIAAVADPQAAAGDTAMALVGGGAFDGLRSDARKALNLLKALFTDGKVPAAEDLAAARSATEIALESLATFKLGETVDQTVAATINDTAKKAAEALALVKELPADPASVAAAITDIEAAVGAALMPRSDTVAQEAPANETPANETLANETSAGGTETVKPEAGVPAEDTDVLPQPADGANGAGEAVAENPVTPESETAKAQTGEPETVEQAPLKQSTSSVIIRKGDTLWQISRRVYGAGVRYTTIYLANEDQISNPDRILPGQVFGVPDEARPDAAELHRKRMLGK